MKFVVIDDDPTGSQTVHDCLLLLKWDCSTLVKGFESKSNLFFIFIKGVLPFQIPSETML